ncbi:MAG: hypothetical protein ACTHL3_03655 [Candidatus Nitrosocosmicus sp.]
MPQDIPQPFNENNESPISESADSNKSSNSASFLSDLTDGREKGFWQTRYDDPLAREAIRYEKNYLLIIIVCNIVVSLAIGLLSKHLDLKNFCPSLNRYIFAFLGGCMGGCVFSAKWLVHSVAKNTWNRDRRLWRIFTPIVSGVLGFVIILLLSTKVITLGELDSANMHKCYGIAFLIGYFSDNAIGKLTEIAQVFFGSSRK